MWWTLLALASAADPATEDPPVAALDAVVLIVTGGSTCSGALIDAEGTVATAYHCVASGGRPAVRTRDGRRTVGAVRGVDRLRDLALIAAPELAGSPWIKVAEDPPALGEEVHALGHPYGVSAPAGFLEGTLRWSMTRGVVSAIGPDAVQFSAPINPGNSGGPVVDAEGQLVAVVSRRTGGSEGLGFGGRSDHLLALGEAPGRGVGALGGTWALRPVLTTWNDPDVDVASALSGGGKLVVAFRDRVVLTGTVRLGLSPRWLALEIGEARFAGPAGRLGLRQRFGRGRFALRLDGWGEITQLLGFTGTISQREVDLRPTEGWAPLVGGQLGIAGAALDVGCSPLGDGCAVSLVLDWPGVVGVF